MSTNYLLTSRKKYIVRIYINKELFLLFFMEKDKANERSGQLMVSDHRRTRSRVTPEELQVRCWPLRWWIDALFEGTMSYRPGNSAAGRHSTVPWRVEGNSYE